MDNTSQNWGMLRAYGLVYRLLAHDVPVRWAIAPGKGPHDADFSASARDLETGRTLGAREYRGGPFFIEAKDREAAMPLINAWLADDCETVVHEAMSSFDAEESLLLTSAPRMAVARDRYQTIAFANFNAAGIPDSTGAAWTLDSPDLLSQSAIAGLSPTTAKDGALWNSDGTPKYCHLTFSYYWPGTRTSGVVQEVRAWLASGNLTHLFAQAESLRTIENDSNGMFLTTGGVTDDGFTPYTTSTWRPSDPRAQFDGSFRGSPDWMDSIGLAAGSSFRGTTERLIGQSTAVSADSRLLLMSGTMDGDPRNGRATYLAGFDYGIELPMSSHPWTNGVRILLNSVLASECNLVANQPVVHVDYGSSATVTDNQITFTLAYGNDGPAPATDASLHATIPAGTTLVSASDGGTDEDDQLTWELSTLAAGSSGQVTYTVAAGAPGSYTSSATLQYLVGVTSKKVGGSQSAEVGESTTPPDTMFLGVPPNPTDLFEATFALQSDQAPATFECSLDGAAYAACAATFTLTGLQTGPHTLTARALSHGRRDPSPASYSWVINARPVAHDDAATVAEDAATTLIAVLANDQPGDAPTAIQAVTSPSHGAVLVSGQAIGYTPEPNFHGSDAFSYTIVDGDGQTSTASVDVTVVSIDDVPVAVEDTASVAEDGEVSVPVLGNDTGLGDPPISITAVTAPFHGTAIIVGDQLHYAPQPNYHGPELLSYTITDGDGETSTAQVVIVVAPVNDLPVAVADTGTTAEDSAGVELDVLANDTLADAPASLVAVTAPAHGSAELTVTGAVRYTPAADYAGADAFSYTVADADGELANAVVELTVTAVNDVPQAVDDVATTDEDGEVNVAVLGNDLGLGDAPVTVTAASAPAHGLATVIGEQVRYAPAPNFHGLDSFTYTIQDLDGETATATVAVTVAPVNDLPVAVADTGTTAEDSAGVELDVLANDTLADAPASLVAVTAPAHGSAALTATGTVSYVPAPDYTGTDAFSYTVADADGELATAAVELTVTAVNDVPQAVDDVAITDEDGEVNVAVLGNDLGLGDGPVTVTAASAPAHGLATVIGAQVRYAPAANFHGLDAFSYTIQDADGETATAMVTVTVAPVNDAPLAIDDAFAADEDSVGNAFAVLGNDQVADAPGTVTAVTAPAHGVAAVVGELVVYSPAADYHGADALTYTVTDADGETSTATVAISVAPVNDTPVAVDDTAAVLGNTTVLVPVLGNDTHLGDGPVVLDSVSLPDSGAAAIEGDAIRYTPNRYFTGVASFTYTIRDADGELAIATVQVAVTSVNLTPTATNDTATVAEDGSVLISVRANDSGGDEPVVLLQASDPPHGTATVVGNDVRYTPDANYFGADSFTYTLRDGDGETATASVQVTVTPVNDTPVAAVDSFTVIEDSGPNLFSVLANDAGLGDAPITFLTVSDPPHGTVVVVGNQLQYTPDANYAGTDAFTYRIRDLDNQQSSTTVFVSVTNVNDPPTAANDSFVVTAGVASTLDVLFNDRDIDGNPLTLTSVGTPTVGTVTIVANKAVYLAPAGFVGAASFTYVVSDGRGGASTATVTLDVR